MLYAAIYMLLSFLLLLLFYRKWARRTKITPLWRLHKNISIRQTLYINRLSKLKDFIKLLWVEVLKLSWILLKITKWPNNMLKLCSKILWKKWIPWWNLFFSRRHRWGKSWEFKINITKVSSDSKNQRFVNYLKRMYFWLRIYKILSINKRKQSHNWSINWSISQTKIRNWVLKSMDYKLC